MLFRSGYSGSDPIIWINGSATTLASQGYGGMVFGVNVSDNGNVYASGYIDNSLYTQIPALWTNGTLQQLSTNAGIATCVSSFGADVYAGGFIYSSGAITTSGVWKNGTFEAYSDGTTRSHIYGLMIR